MHKTTLEENNPLINDNSDETLKNVQSMLVRIQALRLNLRSTCGIEKLKTDHSFSPDNELHIRLLTLVKEAIEHEIKKLDSI